MTRARRNRHYWRTFQASLRDTYLLLREFFWPLLLFSLAMVGGGLLYFVLSRRAGLPLNSEVEAVYVVLSLTFLQPLGDFPDVWYLQLFYFLMPVAGIGILAQGLTDFGRLFFNRHARGKEWEMAVASTFRDHVVLVGLGHLGFRVAQALHDLQQDVVVIELDPKADLIVAAREMDIPVIQDDGKRQEALEGAGIARASTIVVCTQNDNMNLQIAFKARKINPSIRVILRIFDRDFADSLRQHFDFQALSATGMAAPTFAASAAGVDITRPITVEGESLSLARLDVRADSSLVGCSVAELEQRYDVSVVLLRNEQGADFHPAGSRELSANDVLAVLAGPQQITSLVADNR